MEQSPAHRVMTAKMIYGHLKRFNLCIRFRLIYSGAKQIKGISSRSAERPAEAVISKPRKLISHSTESAIVEAQII